MDSKAKNVLVKTRGLIKASLTRMKTFVDKFEQGSDLIQLRIRSERMPNILHEYDEVQRQLELDDDDENHEQEREAFEELYYSVLAQMTFILEEKMGARTNSNALQSNPSSDGFVSRKLNLPNIKLPTLSGTAIEFRHFHDTFNSLVIKNGSLDEIQRYHYLLSSLSGEAHKLVENLPITADNFIIAWEIICKRYDNPKLIATAHIKSLMSLPTMNKDSVTDLRVLLNQLISNHNALQALELQVPLHEVLLSQLVLENIDEQSRKEWEVRSNTQQFSRLSELLDFLENRCQALELVKSSQRPKDNVDVRKSHETNKQYRHTRQAYVTTDGQCLFCKHSHLLHKCYKFTRCSIPQRKEFVKQNRLCYNCLQAGHKISECNSSNCRSCGQRHHTLLHREDRKISTTHQQHKSSPHQQGGTNHPSLEVNGNQRIDTKSYCSLKGKTQTKVHLSTALINVHDTKGKMHTCRALLDSCSQSHFVTESLVQRLNLKKTRNCTPIQGISNLTSEVKHSTVLQISSRVSHFHDTIECLVLPKISGDVPSTYVNVTEWNLPNDLPLADPDFNEPGKIDLLLGAEIFFHLLKPDRKTRPGPYPVMQNTELGWILAGRFQSPEIEMTHRHPKKTLFIRQIPSSEEQLQRFWEMEEMNQPPRSREEMECEQHFVQNITRDEKGRFIVRLPFKRDLVHLGESRQMAITKFHQLERRPSRNPTRWKIFVANRIAEIQEATSMTDWRHVPSGENPADLISRGVNINCLTQSKLWWNGPSWLQERTSSWPKFGIVPVAEDMPEQRKIKINLLAFNDQQDLLLRFSNLRKLQRVIAYCLRFVTNAKAANLERHVGQLTIHELQNALQVCIKITQGSQYTTEIYDLESKKSINSKSQLKSLNPFLCKNKILRVGGRLQESQLSFDQKHPAILPPKHHLTKLIIEAEHKRMLHAGCQLLHTSLRQHYWIVNGRSTIRKVIRHCLICHKLKAETTRQLMGRLPKYRVESTRVFSNTGIDYAGPLYIKSGSRRTKTKSKCYVAVFICLATRAIHLEVVSDMTTQTFLPALKRFISRRGRCSNIYSDNGTTFVGANKELCELNENFNSIQQQDSVMEYITSEGIQWHFIPPGAPHFGGIWEAGVKSFKHHLRRVMGLSCLTFEELTNLVTQIEACLNSRRLVSISNDPNDPSALIPGHFLIGQPITSFPEPDLSNVRIGLLSRWQQLQRQLQIIWKRWSNDYLTHLQQRGKWSSSSQNVQPGTLLVVKEDNSAPCPGRWELWNRFTEVQMD